MKFGKLYLKNYLISVMIVLSFSSIFSIFVFLSSNDSEYTLGFMRSEWKYFLWLNLSLLITVAIWLLVMAYLEGKFKVVNYEKSDIASLMSLRGSIVGIEERLGLLEISNSPISDRAKKEIVDLLKKSVLEQAVEDVERELINLAYRNKEIEGDETERSANFADLKIRLNIEIGNLNRRGNINLVLGITITAFAMIFLGWHVFSMGKINGGLTEYLLEFVPKLSFVIMMEIFAFFFLGLYKSSLSEIRYYQNEITNIELKQNGYLISKRGSPENIMEVARKFVESERNNILNKDQTTLELEKLRIQDSQKNEFTKNITDLLSKILGQKNS